MQAAIYLMMAAACLAASEAGAPAGQTKCTWARGEGQQTITLYADGRMANAKGQTKNYRWRWTDQGLMLKWYSGRFLFKPDGEGGFRGRQTNPEPGTETPEFQLRVHEPDRAGVLAWTEPLLDGMAPSGIERQADAAARAVVAGQMAKQWARVDAAGRKLDAALRAVDEAARAEVRRRGPVGKDRVSMERARREEQKYKKRTYRRLSSAYSFGSFTRALSDWKAWESRRKAAQWNLEHNQKALERATDRRQKRQVELRQAWAAYEIAAADYAIEFWTRWRPIYQQHKAVFKAEAARVLADADARKAGTAAD